MERLTFSLNLCMDNFSNNWKKWTNIHCYSSSCLIKENAYMCCKDTEVCTCGWCMYAEV